VTTSSFAAAAFESMRAAEKRNKVQRVRVRVKRFIWADEAILLITDLCPKINDFLVAVYVSRRGTELTVQLGGLFHSELWKKLKHLLKTLSNKGTCGDEACGNLFIIERSTSSRPQKEEKGRGLVDLSCRVGIRSARHADAG
jgi:hypothetical protein